MTAPRGRRPRELRARSTEILAALGRVADLSPTAQASVPGAYAWSVTVGPIAFAPEAPAMARAFAALGAVSLASAPLVERRRATAARVVSVWGLVSTSLLVWIAVPSASLSPLRIDVVRGIAGMLGWALFAIASAAPALPRPVFPPAVESTSRPSRSRGAVGMVDFAILCSGPGMAAVMQVTGWRIVEPERGLLVRILGVAGGLACISVAASVVAGREAARTFDSPRRRIRRAILALVGLGLLAVFGLLVALVLAR